MAGPVVGSILFSEACMAGGGDPEIMRKWWIPCGFARIVGLAAENVRF